jgi:membrane-associated phospholipid phosphatase
MDERSYKTKVLAAWSRFAEWVNQHQPIARLIFVSVGLLVFLALLPGYVRTLFWHGLQSHKVLAAMLLVFLLLGISLVWSTGQKLDAWAFLLFNLRGSRPIWLDRLMIGFTQIGSGIVAIGIALVLFFAGNRLLAYELMLGTLSLWMFVEILKLLVNRSRPFIQLTQARIVGFRAIGRSFPSGHTSQSFFMATLLSQYFHPGVLVVLLLYTSALIVGITRMYVGAHYPRDVVAGAILGSAWGLIGVIVSGYVL